MFEILEKGLIRLLKKKKERYAAFILLLFFFNNENFALGIIEGEL